MAAVPYFLSLMKITNLPTQEHSLVCYSRLQISPQISLKTLFLYTITAFAAIYS